MICKNVSPLYPRAVPVQNSLGVRVDRVEPHVRILRIHLDSSILRQILPHRYPVYPDEKLAPLLDDPCNLGRLLLQRVGRRVLDDEYHQILLAYEIHYHWGNDRVEIVGRVGIVPNSNVEFEGKLGRVDVVEGSGRSYYAGRGVHREVIRSSPPQYPVLELPVLSVVLVVGLHLDHR